MAPSLARSVPAMEARRLERHIAGVEASHRRAAGDARRAARPGPRWTSPRRAGCRAGPSATCSPTWPATPTGWRGCSVAGEEGRTVDRYAGGGAGRDAEIEPGRRSAGRPSRSTTSGARSSASRRQWAAQVRWDGRSIETSGQEIPVGDLPFLRWREVEVHRVDLGVGVRAGGLAAGVRPRGARAPGDALERPPADGPDRAPARGVAGLPGRPSGLVARPRLDPRPRSRPVRPDQSNAW